jgi:hypothetical protein
VAGFATLYSDTMRKEGQPPSPPALRLWEQRSIEGWENVCCLDKRFERSEQVAVINIWLEDRQQARNDDVDDLP